jgi:hypothetical protein
VDKLIATLIVAGTLLVLMRHLAPRFDLIPDLLTRWATPRFRRPFCLAALLLSLAPSVALAQYGFGGQSVPVTGFGGNGPPSPFQGFPQPQQPQPPMQPKPHVTPYERMAHRYGEAFAEAYARCPVEVARRLLDACLSGLLDWLPAPRSALVEVAQGGPAIAEYLLDHLEKLRDPDTFQAFLCHSYEVAGGYRDLDELAAVIRTERQGKVAPLTIRQEREVNRQMNRLGLFTSVGGFVIGLLLGLRRRASKETRRSHPGEGPIFVPYQVHGSPACQEVSAREGGLAARAGG